MSDKIPEAWDWGPFRQWFEGAFPFGRQGASGAWADPGWVEQFVRDIVHQRMPQQAEAAAQTANAQPAPNEPAAPYHVFETSTNVVVRLPISAVDPRGIGVLAGSHQVIVDGLPDGRLRIPMPTAVRKDKARAIIKDDTLQIRLLKRGQSEPLRDIPVRIIGWQDD